MASLRNLRNRDRKDRAMVFLARRLVAAVAKQRLSRRTSRSRRSVSPQMRIYVIGSEGQVARSLRDAAAADREIEFGFGRRPDVDLLDAVSIERSIAEFHP